MARVEPGSVGGRVEIDKHALEKQLDVNMEVTPGSRQATTRGNAKDL